MFHAENKHGVEMVEIKSSLHLQLLLYYQSMFSLLYFLVSGGTLMNKLYNYDKNPIMELLMIPIFLLWSATEVARVFLGYIGNIKEKVPMISAFLLLTIFPQFVAVAFFSYLVTPVFPFDMAAGSIMLVLLILELVIGRMTLNVLIQRHTAQFFRLCQEESTAMMLGDEAQQPPPSHLGAPAPPPATMAAATPSANKMTPTARRGSFSVDDAKDLPTAATALLTTQATVKRNSLRQLRTSRDSPRQMEEPLDGALADNNNNNNNNNTNNNNDAPTPDATNDEDGSDAPAPAPDDADNESLISHGSLTGGAPPPLRRRASFSRSQRSLLAGPDHPTEHDSLLGGGDDDVVVDQRTNPMRSLFRRDDHHSPGD